MPKMLRLSLSFIALIISSHGLVAGETRYNPEEAVRLHVAETPCPQADAGPFSGFTKCATIASNKFPELVFIAFKSALDLAALITSVEQIGYFDAFKDNVLSISCNPNDPICGNNTRDLMRLSRQAPIWGMVAIIFSSVALMGDVMAFFMYCCDEKKELLDSNASLVLGASALASGGALLSALGSNGILWNAKMFYMDKIPLPIVDSLKEAMDKGWPVLFADIITGLPGSCMCCYFLAASER